MLLERMVVEAMIDEVHRQAGTRPVRLVKHPSFDLDRDADGTVAGLVVEDDAACPPGRIVMFTDAPGKGVGVEWEA